MMGEMCCLLQICCDQIQQRAALAKLYEKEGLDPAAAAKAAEVTLANFDLAPCGSLLLLYEGIKRAIKGEKD